MTTHTFKTHIRKAFKELETHGYIALMDFQCCQSCGWNALGEEEAKKAVFYHNQDAEQLRESQSLHLAWSGDGHFITSILSKYVTVDWDGDFNKRIHIKVKEQP
jgi:hypothetical protein